MTVGPSESRIRSVIEDRLSDLPDVGMVVGVVDGKDQLIVTHGFTDLTRRHAVSADTIFEIGDLTKVFTGLLLADMVKRGEVKADDHVAKYLPEGVAFTNGTARSTQLIDLATSSAGMFWNLPRVSIHHRDATLADSAWLGLDSKVLPIDRTVISDRSYLYSDLGFGILGHALAKRHKTSYRQMLRDRLMRPLILEDTMLGAPSDIERVAQGHDKTMKATSTHLHLSMFAGSDGLSSTARDMVRFIAGSIEQQFTRYAFALRKSVSVKRATSQPTHLAAMGWFVMQFEGREILWRGSDVDGFSSWIGLELQSRRGIVVLANVGTPVATDVGFRLLLSESARQYPGSDLPVRRDLLDAYAGQYRLTDGQILTIARREDHLTLSLDGLSVKKAVSISDRGFVALDAGVRFTFDFTDEDQRYPTRAVFYQDGRVEVAERL